MVTIDDLQAHVLKFGIDTYPQIEIRSERTHLNLFYEELTARWPGVYAQILASADEFQINGNFGARQPKSPTFVLTQRGPVFIFPLKLPPPLGDTGLSDSDALRMFQEARALFASAVAGRMCMRIGLIRELIFATGESVVYRPVTPVQKFAGADFKGGESLAVYRDTRCNVRIKLATVELATQTRLPVGMSVTEPGGRGLHVELDVNNADPRMLESADIQGIMDRATSLWPAALLEYLREALRE